VCLQSLVTCRAARDLLWLEPHAVEADKTRLPAGRGEVGSQLDRLLQKRFAIVVRTPQLGFQGRSHQSFRHRFLANRRGGVKEHRASGEGDSQCNRDCWQAFHFSTPRFSVPTTEVFDCSTAFKPGTSAAVSSNGRLSCTSTCFSPTK